MNHAKDPLLWISIVLGVLGAVQSATGVLSVLAAKYPIAFGLAMTGVSSVTAGLTAYYNSERARLARLEATEREYKRQLEADDGAQSGV